MKDNIYQLAEKILLGYGKLQQLSIITVGRIYQDKKIFIEGSYPLDLQDSEPFDDVYIALKLSSNSQLQRKHFGLNPTAEKDYTQVYHWDWSDGVDFFRPGQWQKYLEQLGRRLDEEETEAKRLHEVPVDDSNLFSEGDADQ